MLRIHRFFFFLQFLFIVDVFLLTLLIFGRQGENIVFFRNSFCHQRVFAVGIVIIILIIDEPPVAHQRVPTHFWGISRDTYNTTRESCANRHVNPYLYLWSLRFLRG